MAEEDVKEEAQVVVSDGSAGQRPDPEKVRGGAVLRLYEEADRVLGEHFVKIAKQLLDNFTGNTSQGLACLKLLMDLAAEYRRNGLVALDAVVGIAELLLKNAMDEGLIDEATLAAAGLLPACTIEGVWQPEPSPGTDAGFPQ